MSLCIPANVVDLVESGVSILIGTRNAELRPATTRGFGVVVGGDRRTLTVLFSQVSSGRVHEDLAANGRIAVGFSRPWDSFAVQIKGTCTEVRAAGDADRRVVEGYLAAYVEQLYLVGLPRSVVKRVRIWPAWAATFTVEDLFLQTPGPDAGKRMEGG